MRVISVAAILSALLGLSAIAADEPDHPALKRWAESKITFRKTTDEHKRTVSKLLQSVEDRARAAGDIDRVRTVKEEREAFEATGKPPKAIKTENFEKDMESARVVLRREATVAKAALLTDKRDTDAAIVQDELDELIGKPAAPVVTKRVFWKGKQGSTWVREADGAWNETDANGGRNTWSPVAETADFVQIHDKRRKLEFRMYPDKAELDLGNGQFVPWGEGGWVEPTAKPATVKKPR